MDRKAITDIIINSLSEVLSETDEPQPIHSDELNESTYLLGRRSILDSLSLIKLIINIEQKLNEDYGFSVIIADERAMSREKSPFRTVETLVEYVHVLSEKE